MDERPPATPPPTQPPPRPVERWSVVLEYGYALWFVATLGVLGFLAGWQIDGSTGRIGGRVSLTLLGLIFGVAIGRTVIRSWRGRGQRA